MPTFENVTTEGENSIVGISNLGEGSGVLGISNATGAGVVGVNDEGNGNGVYGRSKSIDGISGVSEGHGYAGVVGTSQANLGYGVRGISEKSVGVLGHGASTGVEGVSLNGTGVYADSRNGNTLWAVNRGINPETSTLILQQLGTGNFLIRGQITGNGIGNKDVFRLRKNGNIWTDGSIELEGNIFAGGDVYSRGVRLTCDKNTKENFSSVNTLQILEKLTSMQIQSWNYKEDPSNERHIGPTAQDFHAVFGLDGDVETYISSIDLQGVALAAIQGLNEKLKVENAKLLENLAKHEARLLALESKE